MKAKYPRHGESSKHQVAKRNSEVELDWRCAHCGCTLGELMMAAGRKQRAKYPRYGESSKSQVTKRDSGAWHKCLCVQCGRTIPLGGPIVRVDIQHDWFRGNDDVIHLCPDCDIRRLPVAVMMARIVEAETSQG